MFVLASPSSPTNFTVSKITSKSVTLHWGPPENNGGSEITGTVFFFTPILFGYLLS